MDVQQVPTRDVSGRRTGRRTCSATSARSRNRSSIGRSSPALEAGAIIGQTGVERVYNAQLMGSDGNRYVVVNSVGREIEKLPDSRIPIDGERLQLTIDYDLQRALEDAFQRDAASPAPAAFLDPRTGEILAMTSLPAYDPNNFAVGIDGTDLGRAADAIRSSR